MFFLCYGALENFKIVSAIEVTLKPHIRLKEINYNIRYSVTCRDLNLPMNNCCRQFLILKTVHITAAKQLLSPCQSHICDKSTHAY